MFKMIASVGFLTAIAVFFPFGQSYAQSALSPCFGNSVSDVGCVDPDGGLPGQHTGALEPLRGRLEQAVGHRGSGSIFRFEKVFNAAPTPLQRFALQVLVPVMASAQGRDDFTENKLKTFTRTLKSVENVYKRGFNRLPCVRKNDERMLSYWAYARAVFVQNLEAVDPADVIEGKLRINDIKSRTLKTVCSHI